MKNIKQIKNNIKMEAGT